MGSSTDLPQMMGGPSILIKKGFFKATLKITDENGNPTFDQYIIYKPLGEIYSGNASDERYLFMILVGSVVFRNLCKSL